MISKNGIFSVVVLGMGVLFILLIARAVNSMGPVTRIEKVRLNIPLVINEKLKSSIVETLNRLEQKRFVYMDLSIDFSDRVPFSVMVNGKPQSRSASSCSSERLLMGRQVSYELGPLADYNHLLMSVFSGNRSNFPYNDISCEYVSSGKHQQLNIRGFFHVIANAIPTAVSLQLRPMNPPFAMAAKVLAN